MLTGARQGVLSGVRRWFAAAMARDLGAFIIPGPEIARAHGLDIEAAGLKKVSSPRHASVLIVVGDTPTALRDAAAVVYAQMMRPRALFVLGAKDISPLPAADVIAGLSQHELAEGVHRLRTLFNDTAFRAEVSDFDAPALQIRIEYVCPMHPEVVQDKPGSCPKCGMTLMPRETQAIQRASHADHQTTDSVADVPVTAHNHHSMEDDAAIEYTCPMHPEVVQSEPGQCPMCGMNLELKEDKTGSAHEHHHMYHDATVEYTCPMHPEVLQNEPGQCPKCGMNLEVKEAQAEPTHEHHHMHHEAAVEYTCPMHPEVVQSEPGQCPKCGMNLEVREAQPESAYEHHHMPHEAAVEYTCPMHPEVVQNEPGQCPKCGMNLKVKEPQAEPEHEHHHMHHEAAIEYTCPMHPEVLQNEPGQCPKCGMNLEVKETHPESAHEHHHMQYESAVEYICPMHPEVVQNEPGSCPKCGMFLEPRDESETQNHDHASMDNSGTDHDSMNNSSMDHAAMDHDDMGFMSMIDVTKDLPRSKDGLPMEWINAPFGPFFPGLPGGLLLTLSLDGDTVAGSDAQSLFDSIDLLEHLPVDATSFVDRLATLDPMVPVSYHLLACQALENAAGVDVSADEMHARIGGLERERIASHLNWLALFGQQTGFDWLMQQAASLQLKIQQADIKQIVLLQPDIITMIKRLQHTPLLKSRTVGIGHLMPDTTLLGPVARACGINDDTRVTDTNFSTLGFTAASRKEGDVHARLQVRLEEMLHSCALIKAAGDIASPVLMNIGENSGQGEAVVETPRGKAHLKLTLEQGRVVAAQLETPSTNHLALIETLTEQQALTDALVAVGSLDLSAWEIRQ